MTAQETHLIPNGQIIPRPPEALSSIGELLCRAGVQTCRSHDFTSWGACPTYCIRAFWRRNTQPGRSLASSTKPSAFPGIVRLREAIGFGPASIICTYMHGQTRVARTFAIECLAVAYHSDPLHRVSCRGLLVTWRSFGRRDRGSREHLEDRPYLRAKLYRSKGIFTVDGTDGILRCAL